MVWGVFPLNSCLEESAKSQSFIKKYTPGKGYKSLELSDRPGKIQKQYVDDKTNISTLMLCSSLSK